MTVQVVDIVCVCEYVFVCEYLDRVITEYVGVGICPRAFDYILSI